MLPRCMINSFQIFSKSVGIFIVIIIAYHWMALPIVIIVIIFYYSNKMFTRTIQALRNLETAGKTFFIKIESELSTPFHADMDFILKFVYPFLCVENSFVFFLFKI